MNDTTAKELDRLADWLRAQGMTPAQVLEEMELFLTHVDSEGTVFRSNHASNYISLAGNLNRDISVMLEKIQKSRERDAFKNESMRRL